MLEFPTDNIPSGRFLAALVRVHAAHWLECSDAETAWCEAKAAEHPEGRDGFLAEAAHERREAAFARCLLAWIEAQPAE